ncbi:hypothetical protein [Streptomyces poonensis]|uniref:Uncharacterized protein n=1 Tax=Streptomyces poonensis TaxID=68255 RepID=A0A918PX71_9ACTN|nr:hypothetical protein [Streptomyces poonensis]GGZ24902.1 hypothetical protein GCM10010365_51620 [Streptomyces poonensis]GLJ93578.1 hypothetical protein GCM10017589_61930 [Streptomyces poonensis]
MARRREHFSGYAGDFGLSALAERLGASGVRADEAQARVLAAEVADDCGGEGAVELGADLRCLLESAVPEELMHTAWLAAAHQGFDPADFGMGMRDWLRRLADRYPARSRKETHGYRPGSVPSSMDEEELREAVAREIRTSASELTHAVATSGSAAPVPGSVPEALERIVRESDGALGFRLFLRALKAYGVPVAKDQYDRLMVLDTRLRYPGPLVYDGLNVQWPPIDTTQRDATGDFGFSELTSWFTGQWHDHTARETVQRAAANDDTAETPGSAAASLLEDTLRLLESSLSSGTITTLWLAASDRGFSIDRAGIDARSWLRTIAEVCRDRLQEVAPSYTPVEPSLRTELTGPVLRELQDLTLLLADRAVSPGWHEIPGTTAAEALEQVVTRVDPDLGYRLLLRLLRVLALPLTEEQYARHRSLGERFGYGAFHVNELELLVEHG